MMNIQHLWGVMEKYKLRTILDVGVGFAKFAYNLRNSEGYRHDKDRWQIKIDGIEIHKNYITPMHEYLYDNIIIGDVNKTDLKFYDIVIMDNFIEHLDKDVALKLIKRLMDSCKMMYICVPYGFHKQEDKFENPYEYHKSVWTPEDLLKVGPFEIDISRNLINAFYRSKNIINR